MGPLERNLLGGQGSGYPQVAGRRATRRQRIGPDPGLLPGPDAGSQSVAGLTTRLGGEGSAGARASANKRASAKGSGPAAAHGTGERRALPCGVSARRKVTRTCASGAFPARSKEVLATGQGRTGAVTGGPRGWHIPGTRERARNGET